MAKLPTRPAPESTAKPSAPPVSSKTRRPTLTRDEWNRRYEAPGYIWPTAANRFLVTETQDLPAGRALDLACGEGRNAVWLAEKAWTVHAVDFAYIAIEKGRDLAAQREVSDRVSFDLQDLRAFTPDTHRYDLVVVVYLQIPQDELAPVLAKAAAAVAAGGTLLLVGHDSENLQRGFGGPQDARLLYTAEQVVAALDGELVIEKAERIEREITTAHGPKLAIDCLVRAKRPE